MKELALLIAVHLFRQMSAPTGDPGHCYRVHAGGFAPGCGLAAVVCGVEPSWAPLDDGMLALAPYDGVAVYAVLEPGGYDVTMGLLGVPWEGLVRCEP